MTLDEAIEVNEGNETYFRMDGYIECADAVKMGIEALRQKEKILQMIQDWDRCVDKEGGEEEFRGKYGVATTELTNLIEKILKGSEP
jgi:hypothetical protein